MVFFGMLTGHLILYTYCIYCSCANENIEKEEGMEIDEKIETNDEISLENQKEIKEEDKPELQTTPNSSQDLDGKEQENRYEISLIIKYMLF